MISKLTQYWAEQGCAVLEPYDIEKGAGTMNPNTFLRALGPEPWKAVKQYRQKDILRQHCFVP